MTPPGAAPLIDQGSGPPLLVFHGWSGSNRNIERWLPALAPRFRVIVPDLPGCDGAPPLGERHTADAYAAFGLRLLDSLGIDAAYVGGLCSGSAIAVALAGRAPDRTTGLLLHTPLLRRELLRPLTRVQLELLASPVGGLYGLLRRSAFLATLYRRLFANAGEIVAAQLAADHADQTRADARAARELATDLLRGDRLDALRGWRRPLAVLVADADAFVDVAAVLRTIREGAPHAAVEVITGGHGWTASFIAAQHEALVRLTAALVP